LSEVQDNPQAWIRLLFYSLARTRPPVDPSDVSSCGHGFQLTIPCPFLIATGPKPLTNTPSYSRYVALKFIVAELTGRNNEFRIYRHLASRSGTHPGSDRVLSPLDHFKVQGPNGEHDVLAFQVVGPHLEDILSTDSSVIRRAIKPLAYQIALGISFLHDCGVVHAGQSTLLPTGQELTRVV